MELLVCVQIPISSRRSTVLELAVFDGQQRKFDNFSSLVLQWKSSNRSLAHFSDSGATSMVLKDDGSGQTRLHGTAGLWRTSFTVF